MAVIAAYALVLQSLLLAATPVSAAPTSVPLCGTVDPASASGSAGHPDRPHATACCVAHCAGGSAGPPPPGISCGVLLGLPSPVSLAFRTTTSATPPATLWPAAAPRAPPLSI